MEEKRGGIEKFFNGVKAEYRKIIWPKKDDVKKETVAVIACSLAIGVIIAVLDFLFKLGMENIINIQSGLVK